MRDPYKGKRRNTNRMPRVEVPPTVGGVPDHAERHTDPNAITMAECPACKSCSLCGGTNLVPKEIADAYCASVVRGDGDEEVSG
jgi:hypothetical protein